MPDQDEDQHIETIATAIRTTLAEHKTEEYMDALNALTQVMIDIVMKNESLSKAEAYQRMAEVFAEHVAVVRKFAGKAKQH